MDKVEIGFVVPSEKGDWAVQRVELNLGGTFVIPNPDGSMKVLVVTRVNAGAPVADIDVIMKTAGELQPPESRN